MHYAHTAEHQPKSKWHGLEEHLRGVSKLTGGFAAAFGSPEWGRLAGMWHDLGKYRPEFQKRLAGDSERVDHAVVGALLATSKHVELGLPLAFVVAVGW